MPEKDDSKPQWMPLEKYMGINPYRSSKYIRITCGKCHDAFVALAFDLSGKWRLYYQCPRCHMILEVDRRPTLIERVLLFLSDRHIDLFVGDLVADRRGRPRPDLEFIGR